MGLMLSRMLGFVLGMSNGTSLVMFAFGGTAIVFGTMATLATSIKRDLSGLSKFMFMGVVILLLASLANIFLQIPALMLTVSVLAIVIFSAFMLIDLQRVVNGGETNYVSATLAIYLDVYNVFANLLAILGILVAAAIKSIDLVGWRGPPSVGLFFFPLLAWRGCLTVTDRSLVRACPDCPAPALSASHNTRTRPVGAQTRALLTLCTLLWAWLR